jgi:hypothetical protein
LAGHLDALQGLFQWQFRIASMSGWQLATWT